MTDTKKSATPSAEPEYTPTEQFLIKVGDFKLSAGLWYTLFGLRLVPFLLYIVPMNVVLGRAIINIDRLFPDLIPLETALLVSWIVAMAGFLALTIFAKKAATVAEFAVGFVYLFFALRHRMFGSTLGLLVLVMMLIFLTVKLVFLVFEIIRRVTFAKDPEDTERDLTGRITPKTDAEVVYTDVVEDAPAPVADGDVYYTDVTDDYEEAVQADGEVVYSEVTPEYEDDRTDEDVVYTEATDDYEEVLQTNEEVVYSKQTDDYDDMPATDDEVVFTDKTDDYEQTVHADDEIFFADYEENTEMDDEERLAIFNDDDFFFG